MPEEAFPDMWNTLKSGHSWTGMVKNRRKNGDHYWVLANATPIRENGTVIGYSSVRTVPSADQIAQASSAYARFKEGRAGSLKISQGQVVRRGVIGHIAALKELHIQGRLTLLIGLLCLLMSAVGALGLYGMHASNQGLLTVYEDRTVPLGQLDRVARLLQNNRLLVSQAIYAANPDEISNAAGKVEGNIDQVQKTWEAYMATKLTPEEQKLAEQFGSDRTKLVNRSLMPAIAALKSGNIDEVKRLEHDVMALDFKPVNAGIDALIQLQLDVARQEAGSAEANFTFMRNTVIAAILLGMMLFFCRATSDPGDRRPAQSSCYCRKRDCSRQPDRPYRHQIQR